MIITTSDFSKDAIIEAEQSNKMPISLVNGSKFVDLLIEHEVGIKRISVDILSIDNEFLDNVESDSFTTSKNNEMSLSIWPLPGGIDQYFQTLLNYLKYINDNVPSTTQSVKWFIKNYDTVQSERTARGYAGVPRSMGLVSMENSKLTLTDIGRQLLNDPSEKKLLEILESRIIGISEILQALKKENLTERQIWTYLNDSLDLGWKTYAQTRFRLLWLKNAGAIQKNQNGQFQLR